MIEKLRNSSLYELIMPSWISGLISAVVTLLIVILNVAIGGLPAGDKGQVLYVIRSAARSLSSPVQGLANQLSKYSLLADAPLIIFWAFVGLMVYFLTMRVIKAVTSTVEIEEETHFVHANRSIIIGAAILRTVLRIVAFLILIGLLLLLIHRVVPESIGRSRTIALAFSSHNLVLLLLWSLALFVLLNLLTSAIRLIFLRPRLFGDNLISLTR